MTLTIPAGVLDACGTMQVRPERGNAHGLDTTTWRVVMHEEDTTDEEWRAVPGWEGLYEVSDIGRVRSLDRVVCVGERGLKRLRGRTLKGTRNRKGYLRVSLSRNNEARSFAIHRLVLEAFVSARPDRHEARHLNGDPADNRRENLAWGSVRQNARDRVRHGTVVRGGAVKGSRLTRADVMAIRDAWARGDSTQDEIATRFGVSRSSVQRVVSGEAWRHLLLEGLHRVSDADLLAECRRRALAPWTVQENR